MASERSYLGDGVYVELQASGVPVVWLSTENDRRRAAILSAGIGDSS